MANFLFFDTETSGFIKKDLPADHNEQAWCIQIGALLTDETGTELERLDVMVKPEGRDMHPMALATHGITLEHAQKHGLLEVEVADKFGILLRKADLLVCHNFDFDWKHVTAMLERNMDNLSDEARSAFYLDTPSFCTMRDKKIIKFCGLKNKANRAKVPKLIELHKILFDTGFGDAHNAFADITATKNCFFELLSRGVFINPGGINISVE